MARTSLVRCTRTVRYGVLLGIAGGLAEIVWIAFYGALTGSDTADVARTITAIVNLVSPSVAFTIAPIMYGILVHMVAAVGLGIVLAFLWRSLAVHWRIDEYVFMLGALTIVWGINFHIVLPLISPAFSDLNRVFFELVPYQVSLMSKLLFGLAGAPILHFSANDWSTKTLVRVPGC